MKRYMFFFLFITTGVLNTTERVLGGASPGEIDVSVTAHSSGELSARFGVVHLQAVAIMLCKSSGHFMLSCPAGFP